MSLLLDALKKAAEQKAERSKEELPEATSSDETVVGGAAAEDASALGVGASGEVAARDDETVIDNTSVESRLDRTVVDGEGAADSTLTQEPSPADQMQSGEDKTMIFDDDDVSSFMGEPEFVRRDPTDWRAPDETVYDQTEAQTRVEPPPRDAGADDTVIDQTEHQQPDETIVDQTEHQLADQTGMDITQSQTRVDITEYEPADQDMVDQERADQTEFEQAEEQTQAEATSEDSTEFDKDPTIIDQTEHQDEDMSLLLVEQEATDFTGHTSMTDPQTSHEQYQAMLGDDDELGLVDTTRHQLPSDDTQSGQTTQQARDTTVTSVTPEVPVPESTVTRADSTSTRTYAPDNYDRTLMKLPNEDASKLFAGMKSDTDVVMTPEHAKKVFHSKSSAQRMSSYRVYIGIGVVLLLGVAVFGAFEYQAQSDTIDASLRPLKRDPMPGVIRAEDLTASDSLFDSAGAGVDSRTIEIIESAEGLQGESVAEPEAEVTDPVDETVAVISGDVSGEAVTQPEIAEEQSVEAEMVVASVTDASSASEVAADETAAESTSSTSTQGADSGSSNLQISSNSRIEEKQSLLQDAYSAYQAGNNQAALSSYNAVLEIDPGNRNALLARAAINVQGNNTAAAVADYQTLLLANPKDSLAMASLLSVTSYSPEETAAQLKQMIREEPDSPYLNFALANAYGAQSRWREAQGYYFTALQNNPDDPNYAYNLAVSLEHISEPRSAMTYYRRALDNFENGLATFNRNLVDERLEMLGKL